MKSRPLVHILQTAAFLVILALILGSSTLVFRFTEGFFLEVKKTLVEAVETRTGSKVAYGSISPSLLQSLEINDFVLYRQSDSRVPFFRINQLKVYFNLWAVLSNRPQEAIREISIENSAFTLDRSRDRDFLDLVQSLMDAPESDLPPIRISGRNLDLAYTDGGLEVLGRNVDFSLLPGTPWFSLELQGAFSGRGLPKAYLISSFSSDLDLRGQFSQDFSQTQWQVGVRNFDSDLLALSSQVFQLSLNGPLLSLWKIEDAVPLNLGLSYNTEAEELEVKLQGADLRIQDIITLKGAFSPYRSYLPQSLTGAGTVSYRSGRLEYRWDGGFRIRGPDPLGLLDVNGRWYGNGEKIHITALEVAGSLGRAGYSGSLDLKSGLPTGLLNLRNLRLGGSHDLRGLVRLRPGAGGSLEVYSGNLAYGGLEAQSLDLSVLPAPRSAEWNLKLSLAGGRPGERNRVSSAGQVTWHQGVALEGNYTLDSLALDPWTALLGEVIPPEVLPYLEGFNLSGSGSGSWNTQGEWRGDTAGLSLRSPLHPGRNVYLVAGVTQNTWNLAAMDIQWEDLRFRLQSQGTWNSSLDLAGSLALETGGTAYSLEGTYSHQTRTGSFWGLHGFSAEVSSREDGTWDLRTSVSRLPLSYAGAEGLLSFSLGGWFQNPEQWDLTLDTLELTGDRLFTLENYRIQLSGQAGPRNLDLKKLVFSDRWSTLQGRGLASFEPSGSIWRGQLLMASPSGGESWSLVLDGLGTAYRGELAFQDFPLGRMGQESFRGSLDAGLTLRGEGAQWNLSGQLQIPDGRFNRDTFTARTNVEASPQEVQVDGGQIRYLGNSLTGIASRINFQTGAARFSSRYFGSFGKNLVTSLITLEASLQERISLSSLGDIFSERVSGKMVLSEIRNNNQSVEDFTLNFSRIKNSTTFRGGVGNFLQGRVNDDGDFRIVLRQPFPVTFTAEGLLSLSSMDARFKDISLDVQALGEILELPLISLDSGRITGSLDVKGNPSSPELFGTLTAGGLTLSSDFLSRPTEPMELEVDFRGREVVIKDSLIKAGTGEGKLTGTFLLEHWAVENFLIQVDIPLEKPLPVSYRLTGLDAMGDVSGVLKVEGNLFKAGLKGDLLVQDVELAVGPQAEGVGSGDYGFGVDIVLTTGKQVSFLWPSKEIAIIKAYASLGQKISIGLNPDNGDFSLDGQIEIRGGDVNLPTQSFFLKEGFIRFRENNTKFDPWLQVRGEQRRRDEGGNFTFIVTVDDFLSRFSPRFETSPSRSQEAVLALVGDSILPGSEYSRLNLDTAISLASDVGTSYFLRPFEEAVKKTFSLDLFSLRTQVFKKALVANTSGNPLKFEDYLDNTSLFLGKYLGDLVFLEGLLTLDVQNPEDGLTGPELSPVLELGMEYQTPFFLFNWRVTPANPGSLFIEDNQVSLIWRFTY